MKYFRWHKPQRMTVQVWTQWSYCEWRRGVGLLEPGIKHKSPVKIRLFSNNRNCPGKKKTSERRKEGGEYRFYIVCTIYNELYTISLDTTGSRKKQRIPLSRYTRQALRCGCWPGTRWRQLQQPATPASFFTATQRSWSWPPNALRSRAFTTSSLTWAGQSSGSMEAWPGTTSLGVCLSGYHF